MARQGRVAPIHFSVTTTQQSSRDSRRVVPPDFSRHPSEELEGLHHAFEDRFGSFRRQSDRERCVGMRPHQNQYRNLSSPLGEVDVNLAEIRFQPLAGIVIQRDERFAFVVAMLLDESADRVVTARIAVLVPQPFEDPHRRMPLLRRLRLVVGEDLQNPLMTRTQAGRDLLPPPRILPRFSGAPQNLAHLAP